MEALRQRDDPFPDVPQSLKDLPRWLLWKLEKRGGKTTKVPYSPKGNGSSTDSSTWVSYHIAVETLQGSPEKYSGIGFVLNGDGISCIDCDHCITDGEVSPEVLEIIEEVDSYTEISPSGTGIHIWFRGNLPQGSGNRKGSFEIYETGRYITITGERFGETPLTLEHRQEQLEIFCERYINTKPIKAKVVAISIPNGQVSEERIAELIRQLGRGKGAQKFAALFKNGDTSTYAGDDSRAVLGLLSVLRHATQDHQEIDALFRRSALYRDHWIDKWERLGASEIATALEDFHPEQQKKRKEKATFEDVCQLIRDTFPERLPKTDLFSGSLHVWHKGRYVKAAATGPFAILDTKMRHSDGFFSHTGLMSAINTYAEMLTPELLVDIPTWDGRDRVSELADVCNVVNINRKYFSEFLKAWGASMFLRAYDNRKHQNQCMILKGSQGIGKDTWIDALVGGLGMYADSYSPTNDEVRKAQILSSLLVVKVPEFERLNKTDPDVLKNDITSDGTQTIGKYGKAVERFEYRCSWIASANTLDFFRDYTGNRRFWVFVFDGAPGEAVRWGYPRSEQDKLQALAQFKQLAAEGYRVSDHAIQCMNEYIQKMTPQDPVELLLFDFDSSVKEKMEELRGLGIKKGDYKGFSNVWLVPNHYLESWGIFDRLSRLHGIRQGNIQRHLTARDRAWKTGRTRGYLAQDVGLLGVTDVTDVEEEVSQEVSHLNV